jgi:hypothetical protein
MILATGGRLVGILAAMARLAAPGVKIGARERRIRLEQPSPWEDNG